MGKLVVLKIGEGNFDSGFPVTLQVGEIDAIPTAEISGRLSPFPELPQLYNSWQSDYLKLESRWRIIKIGRGGAIDTKVLLKQCKRSAGELRNGMIDWLRAENREFQPIREKILQELRDQQEEIRVFIQTNQLELKKLPWNEWDIFSETYKWAEIALIPPSYSRVTTGTGDRTGSVRILAILGDNTGINTENDRAEIKALTDPERIFLEQPQREELYEQLRDDRGWDILFFAGHSSSSADGETGKLQVNLTETVAIDELKKALQQAIDWGLQLAIFNSCDGLGLAKQLVDLNIPQVIVMREPVPDDVAQNFLKNFLAAFANGQPLYLAVREARDRLEIFEQHYPGVSWLPVICQNPAQTPVTWRKNQENTPEWVTEIPARETWRGLHAIAAHSELVKSVAISPNGKIIASGSLDHTVKLWDLETGKLLHAFTGHTGPVSCVKFSPDGQTIASSSAFKDGTIRLWDLDSKQQITALKGNDWIVLSVWSIAFSPDGKILASAHHADSTVKIWNLENGQLLRTLRGHVWAVESVAISPDGQTVVSGSLDSNIKIWNLKNGQLIQTLNGPADSPFSMVQSWFSSHSIWSIAISPDGTRLASGGAEQPIKIWNLKTGKQSNILEGHSDTVLTVAFSPDGKSLASGAADGTIRIWDLLAGEPIHTLGHSDAVYCVTFSPDGKTLVSSSKDKTIKIWQLDS
ncbi:MAG: hypothetical protein Fur0025_02020 [Oscillatoriaceae cyanobacterium]